MQTSQQNATAPSLWSRKTMLWLALLLVVSAVLRLGAISKPYYVDGPKHVRAIETGRLVIQAPGYYLFNLSGQIFSRVLHCSATHALTMENLFFGELAILLFALLCLHRFTPAHGLLLTACYAVSPLIWFASDVQSTYAAMTVFAPLLFLCCEDWDLFPLGCFFWAVMAGFRPSDGVFVLPWLIWQGARRSWSSRLVAVAVALPTLLAWVVPTVQRFGGLSAFLHANRGQAAGLAQGVLAGHPSIHSGMEVLRATAGIFLGWGLLFPVVVLALVLKTRHARPVLSVVIWMAPGLLFFTLYYIADPVYVAYFVAPGLLAAGYFLEHKASRTRWYLATITTSLVFMLLAHPIAGKGKSSAVLNAYVFKFTRWSLKHEYAPRLASLLGVCGHADVAGPCKDAP